MCPSRLLVHGPYCSKLSLELQSRVRMVFIAATVLILTCIQVIRANVNRCPSEAGMMLGYRNGHTCMTFADLKHNALNVGVEISMDICETICPRMFLGGKRVAFTDLSAVEKEASWRKSLHIRNWGFCHCFFLTSSEFQTFRRWLFEKHVIHYVWIKTYFDHGDWHKRWYKYNIWNNFEAIESQNLLDQYNVEKYNKLFEDGPYPLCPTYTFDANGIHHDELSPCINYYKNSKRPNLILCEHRPYRNCKWKTMQYCHYDQQDNKWYGQLQMIYVRDEAPYGEKCPEKRPSQLGPTCEPTCRGVWGEWTSEPEEPNLRCNKITVYRYKPANRNDPPCNQTSITCCLGAKVINYNNSCTDFAYNSTVNLKKEGCLNGGRLSVGKYGHLECICSGRYTGIRCNTDACEEYCENGGTCYAELGKPYCICRRGFTNTRCNTVMPKCGELGECQNGGKCERIVIKQGIIHICKCPQNYGGGSCQFHSEKCQNNSCNFRGVCKEDKEYNIIKCQCYDGYYGDRCNKVTEKLHATLSTPTTSNVSNAVLGLTMAFVILGLIFGASLIHQSRIRRKRKLETSDLSSYSDSTALSILSTFRTALSKTFRSTKRASRNAVASQAGPANRKIKEKQTS